MAPGVGVSHGVGRYLLGGQVFGGLPRPREDGPSPGSDLRVPGLGHCISDVSVRISGCDPNTHRAAGGQFPRFEYSVSP